MRPEYRFDDDTRRALVRARQEAAAQGQGQVAAEHLLLGILAEPTAVVGSLLEAGGVDRSALRAAVTTAAGEAGPGAAGTEGRAGAELPYSSLARQALEAATGESTTLGHDHVGPEHLLLGLLHVAATRELLSRAGLDLERSRVALSRLRPSAGPGPGDGPRGAASRAASEARLALVLAVAALAVAAIALVVALT